MGDASILVLQDCCSYETSCYNINLGSTTGAIVWTDKYQNYNTQPGSYYHFKNGVAQGRTRPAQPAYLSPPPPANQINSCGLPSATASGSHRGSCRDAWVTWRSVRVCASH